MEIRRCLPLELALAVATFAIISFPGLKAYNSIIKQEQYITITQEQEIALDLQAAPEMTAQFGGLDTSELLQNVVDGPGAFKKRLMEYSRKAPRITSFPDHQEYFFTSKYYELHET